MAYNDGNGGMQDVAVTREEPAAYDGGAGTTYAPKQQGAVAGASGFNGASIRRVFTSPPGILRLVEWLTAVIAFGTIADSKCGITGCTATYADFSEFEYGLAIGVLVWLYTMVMMVVSLLDLQSSMNIIRIVEFGCDAGFAFLTFVGGCAVAAKCDKEESDGFGGSIKYCSSNGFDGKMRAGAAFLFLTCFALLGSAFFSWKRFRGGN